MKIKWAIAAKLVLVSVFVAESSLADVFSGDGTIGNVRQSASETLQVNHSAVVGNNCSTKNYAYAIPTTHPNFKNIYAAVLTAKAAESTVQFAAYDNQCIDGFPEVNVMTVK
jgi:hypothetical protein